MPVAEVLVRASIAVELLRELLAKQPLGCLPPVFKDFPLPILYVRAPCLYSCTLDIEHTFRLLVHIPNTLGFPTNRTQFGLRNCCVSNRLF